MAWTGALAKRGELEQDQELVDFAHKLEQATLQTIEEGKMTGDLAAMTTIPNPTILKSRAFIQAIAEKLDA